MHVTPNKTIAVGLWISTMSAVGLIGGMGSFPGWLLLSAVALVSPLALQRIAAPRPAPCPRPSAKSSAGRRGGAVETAIAVGSIHG